MRRVLLTLMLAVLLPLSLMAQVKGSSKANTSSKPSSDTTLVQVNPLQKAVDDLTLQLREKDSLLLVARLKESNRTRIIDSLKSQLAENQERARTLESEKRHLQDDVDDLLIEKKEWLEYLAWTMEDKWKGKIFTMVDLVSLTHDIEECNLFSREDKRIQKVLQQMGQISDAAKNYRQGKEVLNRQYDKEKIESLIPRFDDLVLQAPDTTTRKEVEQIRDLLNDYRPTIRLFQGLIKSVDAEVDPWTGKAAWKMAERLIKQEEEKKGIVSAICDIPWLARQYDAYYEALQKDCKGNNPARETIMSIEL